MNRKQRRALGTAKASGATIDALFAEAVRQHRSGRLAEAERLYGQVLGTNPRHAPSLHLLGVAAGQAGRFNDGAEWIGASLRIDPANAEAHNDLGNVLRALGRSEEAIAVYRRAAALRPDYAQAHFNLGILLVSLGRYEAAVAAFQEAVARDPANFAAHNQLGAALHEVGRSEEALQAFEAARRLNPASPEASVNLAIALRELGRTAEALAATEVALAADPASARAWYVRSDLKRFAPGDPDLAAMEALAGAPDADVVQLEFGLGKAWRDAGDVDRAFAHFAAGNRLKRASFTYDVEADAARFAGYAALTPAALTHDAAQGVADERPVFIVGMPRSGTTLVEQILASHSQVVSVGEAPFLGEAVRDAAGVGHPLISTDDYRNLVTTPAAAALGEGYLGRLPQARRVLDKTPANFQFAGLIALALPGARIIHCRRDAADTCFSCFATMFTGQQDFAYDLAELGRYHRAYLAAMDHWRTVLPPNRLLEIHYEAVVEDLEAHARRLVGFIGLDWEDACLDFHQSSRVVRTASASQVRRPAYRTSVGASRAFAAHLGPLLDALEGR